MTRTATTPREQPASAKPVPIAHQVRAAGLVAEVCSAFRMSGVSSKASKIHTGNQEHVKPQDQLYPNLSVQTTWNVVFPFSFRLQSPPLRLCSRTTPTTYLESTWKSQALEKLMQRQQTSESKAREMYAVWQLSYDIHQVLWYALIANGATATLGAAAWPAPCP